MQKTHLLEYIVCRQLYETTGNLLNFRPKTFDLDSLLDATKVLYLMVDN